MGKREERGMEPRKKMNNSLHITHHMSHATGHLFGLLAVIAVLTLTLVSVGISTTGGTGAQAQAGYITSINIIASSQTDHWQGYYGALSSTSPNVTEYPEHFTSPPNISSIRHIELNISSFTPDEYLLITDSNSLNVTGLQAGDPSMIDSITGTGSDSGTNTFTDISAFYNIPVRGDIQNVPTVYIDGTGSGLINFREGLLRDGNNSVFIAPIVNATAGYNGILCNFQFVLPTNYSNPITYYIYYLPVTVSPDLTLASSDILFSPENPTIGQPVNITVIVHNIGGYRARNIAVDFYINSTPVIIREEIDKISPHSKKSVSINYTFLSAGLHSITVKIDANNTIIEQNEADNQVTKFITVAETPAAVAPRGARPTPTPELEVLPPALRDTTPPIISNVSVTIERSVIITWDTNEKSDSLVKCGVKSRQYTIEEHNTSYTRSHVIPLKEIPLKNIYENTTYYFVVNSTDSSGNSAQTEEYVFVLTPPEHRRAIIPFILQLPLILYTHTWWLLLVLFATIIFIPIITVMGVLRYKSRKSFNSLMGKPVKTEILMYLYTAFPDALPPVDISKRTEIDMNGVLEALHTMTNKNKLETVLGVGLLDKVEQEGKAYYRISKRGKSLMDGV